ncbi:hypothetical protein D9757_001392 [Collybiopsis confluens]|uniref:ARID domain-containing protein n=1 Tax=Collybiopsis confluens TaxID=2823264 RepID=A0A8H5HZ07_9AGAR|nr:hypothetical protein D9757_001392 [Collybiopsis confluens]
MDDRLSQYPMMPNFPSGITQHRQLNAMQQQPQQPAQQQQDSQQQPHPTMSGFNDQGRVWSQMQSMRTPNSQDMNTPSAQQQASYFSPIFLPIISRHSRPTSAQNHPRLMANLLRSQNIAQIQSQQQAFGMGMGGAPNPTAQQRSFLEQQNQAPHNMQMGFGGMEQHNPSFQASMHNRQSMLQALQGNQSHTRQLELMGLAQNQQNQNGPTNMGNRSHPMNGNPQGLNTLQAQNELSFNPNDMRRPSPHPPLQPPMMSNQPPNGNNMTPNGTISVQGRTINLGDLTERATSLRDMIKNLEMSLRHLQSQRTTMPDNVFLAKMRQHHSEIASRKESLSKIVTLMNYCMLQGANGGPINNMGGPSQGPSSGNGGQSWQPPPFGNNQSPPGSQSQQPGVGPRSSPAPPHSSNGIQPLHNSIPPRSVPTPLQGGHPFPMNPNFPNNSPANGSPGPNAAAVQANLNMPIQPLEKSRFETSYKQWCLTKAIVHNPQLLSIDNRTIDLYQLHCQVMREGGFTSVTHRELWPTIGGRLNIVHFTGSATEPPKSGPAAAVHIQQVYKDYLSAFDTVYMASVMDSRRKAAGLPATSGQFLGGGGGGPPPRAPTMPVPVTLEALRKLSPPQVDGILSCADKPANELRARGMAEVMINFIENHRPMLQTMASERANFGDGVRGRQLAGQNPVNGNQPPFPNPGMGNMNPQLRPPGEHPGPLQPGAAIPRPSREQLSAAQFNIHRLKSEYQTRLLPMMPPVEIAPEIRPEYSNLLEIVSRQASELDSKLHIYSTITKSEENTKRLLTAIVSVQHQRSLSASPNPKFVVSFETLRVFANHLHNATRQIQVIIQSIVRGGEQHGPSVPFLDHPPNNGLGPGGRGLLPVQSLQYPGQPLSSPSQVPAQVAPYRPPAMALNPPPTKAKKPVGAPTPPASAATPVASASTPTAASSPTPKSPKPKSQTKKSKPTRKPSTSSAKVNATPTLEPAQVPGSSSSGVKRQRDDDSEASQPTPGTSSGATFAPPSAVNEPSPKRLKPDWEGPVSESLLKKNQEVENIKTEEDATQFLEQMTELIKMAGTEEQAALSSDISDTLEQILRGYAGPPDSDTSLSSLGLGEVASSLEASASTSAPSGLGDITEFFDFSPFPTEEESESKIGTPDLISSSSTNPSPESQADADPAHHAVAMLDSKQQEEFDPLRLGPLKEIDGGESAFFHAAEWKWDGPMPSMESPWAIHNS